MRIRIALACFVIGAVLIGLNFLNLRLTDALRPYLLYAGIGLLVLGFVLAVVRWSRDELQAGLSPLPEAVHRVRKKYYIIPAATDARGRGTGGPKLCVV